MRITTKISWDKNGRVVEWRGHTYFGPIAELKKGSGTAKEAASGQAAIGGTAQGLSKSDLATQTGARTEADPFVKSLMPSSDGKLSPYAQAQYGQSKVQNAQNAMDQRAIANKAAALRGFNNSPGVGSSNLNSILNRQGISDTMAYNNALQSTLGQGLEGIKYLQGQQEIYDPTKPLNTGVNAYSGETSAAQVQNQSPTLLGDIGQGIAGIGPAVGKLLLG